MTPFFITETYRDEFQILLDLYNTITKIIANQNAMSIWDNRLITAKKKNKRRKQNQVMHDSYQHDKQK